MHHEDIQTLVSELQAVLPGRFAGRVFQLSPYSLALDFGLRNLYLLLNVEPSRPRLYLVNRRVRDLEKQSIHPTAFAQTLRKSLSDVPLESILMDPSDRIVRFCFNANTLIAQLTGRSANLFLLDADNSIVQSLRPARGKGQQPGEVYQSPPRTERRVGEHERIQQGTFGSLSEALDQHHQRLEEREAFAAKARSVELSLNKQIAQQRKLQQNLNRDLDAHGDAEQHRRTGELLLANLTTASRNGGRVKLTDYYSAGEPVIELEIDEHQSLKDEAARYFARYSKAKRAREAITRRLKESEQELDQLRARAIKLETIVSQQDDKALDDLIGPKKSEKASKSKTRQATKLPGIRRYRSSDGFEVLVGRGARENDYLTFKVAGPHDVWLHAADYPGSHVVIRNPTRKEVPHRTIIEAAQLAARFSHAAADGKVDIHYTHRKFLTKPKGAAAGLVRMSSFRSLTVEPGENIERL